MSIKYKPEKDINGEWFKAYCYLPKRIGDYWIWKEWVWKMHDFGWTHYEIPENLTTGEGKINSSNYCIFR